MASRPDKIGAVTAGGIAVAGCLLLICLGTLAAVFWRASGSGLAASDYGIVRFTVVQAAVSALLSVMLAVPLARALARRRFWGRGLVITLLGAPFLVPVIVAVLGLQAVFGRSGLLNSGLVSLGQDPVSIYGFHGVVLAHVFFNLPLAVRMLLQGWQAIPAERFRVAAALGFAPANILRHLERPMLRAVLPGAAMVIFTLCLSSFTVALVLGGGPRATTVELAIYQALRFEFDLGRASLLSGIQFGLCAVAALLSLRVAQPLGFGAGLDREVMPWWGLGRGSLVQDTVVVAGAVAFLVAPLAMVVLRGVPGLSDLPASLWPALAGSLGVAAVSTVLTLLAALLLASAIVKGRFAIFLETAALLPLAASGLVLGTGLFLIVHPFATPDRLSLPVTALVNATLALPFALRVVLPALRDVDKSYGRLAQSLSLGGLNHWRWVVLPRIRAPLGFAAGLVAALSIGDLGAVALFAGERGVTLPLLVQRLTGSYQNEAAAGAALVLLAVSFTVFLLLDWIGRRHADL